MGSQILIFVLIPCILLLFSIMFSFRENAHFPNQFSSKCIWKMIKKFAFLHTILPGQKIMNAWIHVNLGRSDLWNTLKIFSFSKIYKIVFLISLRSSYFINNKSAVLFEILSFVHSYLIITSQNPFYEIARNQY